MELSKESLKIALRIKSMRSELGSITNTELLGEACQKASEAFHQAFDAAPEIVAAAPGRVNLIGEHVDYNDGFVLPFAIDRYTVVAGKARSGSRNIRLFSGQFEELKTVALDKLKPLDGCWTNYLTGVVAGFQDRGHEIPGFDAAIYSNVPTGAGLSSSAALEVATATLLESLLQSAVSKLEKALICQTAEHVFAGVPCGIMDQFASVFGETNRLVEIDCRSQEVTMIDLANNDGLSFLITNTQAEHQLVDGEYAARKQQSAEALTAMELGSYRVATLSDLESAQSKLSDAQLRRGRHVITEIERTQQATKLARAGDWESLGTLMYASHDSLRDDYEVSCQELDLLVATCQQIGVGGGVLGSRMTGGGFGGCTITLARTADLESIKTTMQNSFAEKFDRTPPCFATSPSQGAHLVSQEGT